MKEMRATLDELGQGHLFAQWSEGGDSAKANEARFFEQMEALDASYPGGLKAYVANARQLLAESKSGVNPLEGWTPKVPTGTSLRFASSEYLEHEQVGVEELDGCSFVLVAGGLGERLGFSGIKVALPYQISTGDCYLQLYIGSILALQRRAAEATGKPVLLPLAIMLSEVNPNPNPNPHPHPDPDPSPSPSPSLNPDPSPSPSLNPNPQPWPWPWPWPWP